MSQVFRLAVIVCLAGALTVPAAANHSWGGYHWARTTPSFGLTVVNSTTPDWDPYVSQAAADWSASAKLDMVEDSNGDTSSKTRRQCNAPNGMVRICNLAYGQNGWLGIAGISVDSLGHITRGYTKLNDTYFAWSFYDTDAWKQSVTCQELGHNVGLSHQDENFDNVSLESCMDYQNPPYPYPNAHDYDQLDLIYGHVDSYDSYAGSGSTGGTGGTGGTCGARPGKGCNKAGVGSDNADIGWGYSIHRRGQQETFLRIDPDGTRHYTFVTWVRGH